jgi:hypothetical protein
MNLMSSRTCAAAVAAAMSGETRQHPLELYGKPFSFPRVLAFANIVMSTPWRYQIVTFGAHTGCVRVRDATHVIARYGPTC